MDFEGRGSRGTASDGGNDESAPKPVCVEKLYDPSCGSTTARLAAGLQPSRSVRILVALCLFLVAFSAASARAAYDVVVDIDWTILSPIPAAETSGRAGLIYFDGLAYSPAPFVVQALEHLLSHPDVRVHIFSGGERPRNLAVLQQLKFSDGTSLLENIEKRGGQVWSQTDLTPVGTTGGNIDRYRKRIEGLLRDAVGERLILIDDQAKFADRLMKAIPSFGVFNDRLSFDASKIGEAYEPVNEKIWLSERSRWLVLIALLDSALAADRAGKISFRDFLLSETQSLALDTKLWHSWTAMGKRKLLHMSKAKSCQNLFAN